jgi:hypothetical protein
MNRATTMLLLGLTVALTVLVAASCGRGGCDQCPRGTHPSDPSRFCSVCVAIGDAGSDTVDATADRPIDRPMDVVNEMGTDTQADGDASGCATDARFLCANASGPAAPNGALGCSDFLVNGTCENGQWTCPGSSIAETLCTCFSPAPFGCTGCGPHGWICPDGGADAADARDALSDVSCNVGCSASKVAGFCNAGEVEWTCQTFGSLALFNASCRDAGTNAVRYCCSPSFLAMCQ